MANFVVIFSEEGTTGSPSYVMICNTRWYTQQGYYVQSNIYDATKFDEEDTDHIDFELDVVRKKFPDLKFVALRVDKRIFGKSPRHLYVGNPINLEHYLQ